MTSSADNYRLAGNECFMKKEYLPAAKQYLQGILKDSEDVRLYSNCAECFLQLRDYDMAFDFAMKGLGVDSNHIKSLYRAVKSLLKLGKIDQAAAFLDEKVPTKSRYSSEIKELRDLIAKYDEESKGEFDIEKMLEEAKSNKYLDGHVENFINTSVEEAFIDENKGNGLVAKEFIPKGTLILAEKAFDVVFKASEMYLKHVTHLDHFDKEAQRSLAIKLELQQNIQQRLKANPKLASKIFSLYAGPEYPRNGSLLEDKGGIQMSNIINKNSFTISYTRSMGELGNIIYKDNTSGNPTGLFVDGAKLNHSCIPSCVVNYIGDYIFFYAYKDIEVGEELTHSYKCALEFCYYTMKEDMFQNWGFHCECKSCAVYNNNTALCDAEKVLFDAYKENNLNAAKLGYQKFIKLYPMDTIILSRGLSSVLSFITDKDMIKEDSHSIMLDIFLKIEDKFGFSGSAEYTSGLIILIIKTIMDGERLLAGKLFLECVKKWTLRNGTGFHFFQKCLQSDKNFKLVWDYLLTDKDLCKNIYNVGNKKKMIKLDDVNNIENENELNNNNHNNDHAVEDANLLKMMEELQINYNLSRNPFTTTKQDKQNKKEEKKKKNKKNKNKKNKK